MAIPKNITKEHIENAINEIVLSEIPKERLSYNYYLVYGDENLPPKYVISIANKFANNELLDSESFNAVEAKDFLLKKGYHVIEKKMEYFDQLKMFLAQAKTEKLAKLLGTRVIRVSYNLPQRQCWLNIIGKHWEQPTLVDTKW